MRNPCRRKVMDMTISNPLMQPETISSVTASTCQFRQAADWFQSNSCPNRTALASLWLLRVLGKQQAPQHTSTLGISRKVMKHQTCATAPRELYHLHFTLQKGMLKDVVRVKNEIQQLDNSVGGLDRAANSSPNVANLFGMQKDPESNHLHGFLCDEIWWND